MSVTDVGKPVPPRAEICCKNAMALAGSLPEAVVSKTQPKATQWMVTGLVEV